LHFEFPLTAKEKTFSVTEQEIERPKKGQKDYYSGKKTTHHCLVDIPIGVRGIYSAWL